MVIEKNPENISAYINLAKAYEKSGNKTQAISTLEKIINKNNKLALNNLGILYKNQKNYQKAIEIFEKAIINSDIEAKYNLATTLIEINDNTRAKDLLKEYTKLKPNNPEALYALGIIEYNENNNSIDSGATKIEVFLEEGGIQKILIIDNGSGISQEDLKICYLPHTTSKISSEEDLRKIETLGFRGEALSSIAICSNISITSSTTGNESYQIEVENGIEKCFKKQPAINGTIVDVTKIFHNFPARKRFLKQEPIETKMCLKVLEEKIITHPEINFEINLNQKLRKIYFKESLIDRVQNVYGNVIENNKFKVLKKEHENIKIEIFLAPANFSKKSKRPLMSTLKKKK